MPHEYGDLQRSGIVTTAPNQPIAYVSYDTPYARKLHEHPEYNFRKGRRGKWLENTVNEQRGKVESYLAKELKEAFKGGGL